MRLRSLAGAVVGVALLAAGSTAFATSGGGGPVPGPTQLAAGLAARGGAAGGDRHHPLRPGQRRVQPDRGAQFSAVTRATR